MKAASSHWVGLCWPEETIARDNLGFHCIPVCSFW